MFQDTKFIKKLFIVVTSYPFPVNSVGIMPHGYHIVMFTVVSFEIFF